jgi:hypothetical protein
VDYEIFDLPQQQTAIRDHLRTLEASHFAQGLEITKLEADTTVDADSKKDRKRALTEQRKSLEAQITALQGDLKKLQP